ncbi:MAG: ATP-binding protein [Clostridia bacterium]
MKKARQKKILLAVRRYFMFFLLMSFVISCCMVLFLNELTAAAGLVLTQAEIERAAKITFANVLFLSLLCTVIDEFRRKWMVDRPVKRIVSAAEKIMQGDLSARVQPPRGIDTMGDFNIVIDYFNRMAEELSGMETLRTDFIANVSHELKTPLAVMQNYAAMLAQPNLPEEKRKEYADAIAEASRRLANLITNILKLNKLENQQIFPAAQAYDLGEQLCECLLAFEGAWEEKRLEIETDIAEEVTVRSDPELLSLVWNNLFSNAIKFTQPEGKISLSLKTEGKFAVVRISDTGCGISEEVGRHIFEKFYQGDPSHASQGNGLGLALVKRVIDITGGDIGVESQVGVGSTFTVRLRRESDGAVQTDPV